MQQMCLLTCVSTNPHSRPDGDALRDFRGGAVRQGDVVVAAQNVRRRSSSTFCDRSECGQGVHLCQCYDHIATNAQAIVACHEPSIEDTRSDPLCVLLFLMYLSPQSDICGEA
eukprot:6197235-Pleurochrysis_carterae.AAC.4